MTEEHQKAETAGRNDFHVERGSDGKRIPKSVYLDTLDMNIKVVQPSWGDGKEFFHDFGGEDDADAVDSDKIAKHFRKLIVVPDLGDLTKAELDEDWDSKVVQEILDTISELYGGVRNEEDEDEEEDEDAGEPDSKK